MSDTRKEPRGWQELFLLVRPYPRLVWAIIGMGMLGALIAAPVPYLAKVIIDDLMFRGGPAGSQSVPVNAWLGVSDSTWMIGWLVLLGLALKLASALAGGWQSHLVLQITRNGLFDTRLRTALHLMGAKQEFFETLEPGRIASRLATDVNSIDAAVYTLLRNFVSSFLLVAVVICFMLAINLWLTAIILITIPLTALLSYLVFNKLRAFSREESDRIAGLAANTTETFSAIKIIRAFNAESFFLKRFQSHAEALRYEGIRHWTTSHAINGLLTLLSSAGGDVYLFVGAVLALGGQITFGEFFAFYGYQAMLWGPISVLLNTAQLLQTGVASAEKVAELGLVPREPYLESENLHSPTSFVPRIELRDLTFGFHPDEPVLRGVSLTLEPGSMTALVGQSGSGKTTLANMLLGVYLAQSGSLLVDGVDIRRWDLRRLRSEIGIVLQEPGLFNDTIRANLCMGQQDVTEERIWAALRAAHLAEFVTTLPNQLDTLVGVNGTRLSGGQKQRVAIARTFLKNPSILILDEATSALDSETERAIQRSFDALLTGRTSVVIAHRLSTIFQADQIVVMHQGRVVEIGTHEDLLQRPGGSYRDLFEAQVAGMIPMSGATRRPQRRDTR